MSAKVNRVVRRDYVTLAAIAAMFLSVAVIGGIIYSYESRRDPSNDLSVLIAPNTRQFPSDL
jgi:hypothetical protein